MHKTLSFAALSLLAVGCGPYLQYRSQPPAPSPAGKVIVEVRDSREPKKGGDKKEEVGVRTGAFGIPDEIRVDSPMTVTETMHKLVTEAALASGIGVAAQGQEASATARVVVDINRLWCAGYRPVYKGDVTASMMVLDPNGQQVRVVGQPVHGEDGGMDCKRIYKKALTDFFNNARALFTMPQVKDAATGANTRAAPPPAQ
jgi:hypothetical protein